MILVCMQTPKKEFEALSPRLRAHSLAVIQALYHVSYTLNSLKGVLEGVMKGDTRSLDYGSCRTRSDYNYGTRTHPVIARY